MARVKLFLFAMVGVAVAALPTSVSADSVKRYQQDGVPRSVVERFGLTDDERRTLDISSMRVTGGEGVGVMVDVRLHGDFQRRLGRNGLRRAALAVTLHSTAGAASPVTVVTRGAVRDQKVMRVPADAPAAAVRTGRTVRVFANVEGFAAIERVEAVSFARGPVAADDLSDAVEADRMELVLDPQETAPGFLSCDELNHMYDGITSSIGGLDQLEFRLERSEFELRAQLRQTKGATKRGALRRALADLRDTHRAVRAQRGLMLTVGGEHELLGGDTCYQPRAGG